MIVIFGKTTFKIGIIKSSSFLRMFPYSELSLVQGIVWSAGCKVRYLSMKWLMDEVLMVRSADPGLVPSHTLTSNFPLANIQFPVLTPHWLSLFLPLVSSLVIPLFSPSDYLSCSPQGQSRWQGNNAEGDTQSFEVVFQGQNHLELWSCT